MEASDLWPCVGDTREKLQIPIDTRPNKVFDRDEWGCKTGCYLRVLIGNPTLDLRLTLCYKGKI